MDENDLHHPGPRAIARLRALRLLAEGTPEPTTARILGVTRQNVNHHARRFRESGALRLIRRRPNIYEPGGAFATAVASAGRHHGGWSSCTADAPVARLHNLSVKATVEDRDPDAPPPLLAREPWSTNGGATQHDVFWVTLPGGRRVKVRYDRGPDNRSVTVWPPSLLVAGVQGMGDAVKVARREAGRALAVLEGRHGFRFGTARVARCAEVAFPAPGLGPVAGYGREGVGHVDESEGPPEEEAVAWWKALQEMRRREAATTGAAHPGGEGLLEALFGDLGADL